jgi:hypothetical protein
MELPLREQGIDKVETARHWVSALKQKGGTKPPEVPDIDQDGGPELLSSRSTGGYDPGTRSSSSVSDTLDGVNDRTGKIVSRIDLPLITITCYRSE